MPGDLNYISSRYIFSWSLVSLKKYKGQKLNNLMWLHMTGQFMSIFLWIQIFWEILVYWLPIMPANTLNVDSYCGRNLLYILQLLIWLIFCFIDIHEHQSQAQVSTKWQFLFVLLHSNPYISIMYILEQNLGLKAHTTCMTYSYYISFLLVCGHCPLN